VVAGAAGDDVDVLHPLEQRIGIAAEDIGQDTVAGDATLQRARRPQRSSDSATGYQSFRTNECDPELAQLYNDNFCDSDRSYWCAKTLRQATDRVMSAHRNDEGKVASIRADF